jgi:DNA-binding XRE family transcriptional regulator
MATSSAKRVSDLRTDGAIAVLPTLGAKLREAREHRRMSLRELSRQIGVSASLISQIELAKASPSVGTLVAIVGRLGLSFDELFADAEESAAGVVAPGPDAGPAPGSPAGGEAGGRPASPFVLRAAQRQALELANGVVWQRLTRSPDPFVDFLHVIYPAGSESCPPNALMTHSGKEYALVLAGRLGATLSFDSFELNAGDSLSFESQTPHRFWTIGDEPARVAWTIVGRTGDPRVPGSW